MGEVDAFRRKIYAIHAGIPEQVDRIVTANAQCHLRTEIVISAGFAFGSRTFAHIYDGTSPMFPIVRRFRYPKGNRAMAILAMCLVEAIPTDKNIAMGVNSGTGRECNTESLTGREHFA